MRLRNIPGARDVMAESEYCIADLEAIRGNWAAYFGNDHPLHVEIGMGKGQFLMQLAAQHPEINYVGVERYASVLLRAQQKMEAHPLPNVRFLNIDAIILPNAFAPAEVARIYLNFSDPWPKDRHAKRRLTSPQFLEVYEEFLAPGGLLEFKTDNQGLFAYSLEILEDRANWTLLAVTHDLHHDATMNAGNIQTEYEEKFAGEGNPICKLIARYC